MMIHALYMLWRHCVTCYLKWELWLTPVLKTAVGKQLHFQVIVHFLSFSEGVLWVCVYIVHQLS